MTITLKNVNTYNLAERDYNKEVGMIRFLTWFGYGTRKSPNVQLHGAIKYYCPDPSKSIYIQGLSRINQVIPVTLLHTILYKASFTFDTKNSKKTAF
jgi:hypothetical protein